MFYDRRGARGNRRMPRRGHKASHVPVPMPDGLRNARAPLGLNRVQPPFWPPSEIPRSVVDPLSTILALSAGRPVFTADYYSVDGVTGKVASFIDWNDPTHLLAQSTSAKQVALPAAHADFAGKLCATFTGAEYYQSNMVTKWPFLSDGTGAELSFSFTNTTVAAGNRVYISTRSSGRGFTVSQGGANANSNGAIASGTSFLALNGFRTGMAAGTPYVFQYRHGTAQSPNATAKVTGAAAATASYSVAAEAGNPEYALVFGALDNGSLQIQGRLRWLLFSPVLSAAQRATRDQAYLQDQGLSP